MAKTSKEKKALLKLIDKATDYVPEKRMPVGKKKDKKKKKEKALDIKKTMFEFLKRIDAEEDDFYETLAKFTEFANQAVHEFNCAGLSKPKVEELKYLISEPCAGWGSMTAEDMFELVDFSKKVSKNYIF